MAWLIWLLTLVAAEGSGAKGAPKAVSQSAQPPWTILPPAEAEHFLHPCSRSTPEGLSGSWTLTPADIVTAEALLPRRIATEIAKVRPELRPKEPARYYRQYGGVLLGDRRLIFVVGLSKAMVDRRLVAFSSWRHEILRLCDFGPEVFGAVFDPKAKAFTSFEFDL
jgi:hypothetical protein